MQLAPRMCYIELFEFARSASFISSLGDVDAAQKKERKIESKDVWSNRSNSSIFGTKKTGNFHRENEMLVLLETRSTATFYPVEVCS